MPVHIETRGGKHCVVEPDGTVVPSGCYEDKGEALARLRAINSAKSTDNMSVNLVFSPKVFADSDNKTSQSITISGDDASTTWLSADGGRAVVWENNMNEEIVTDEGGEVVEKFGGAIGLPPTSFHELEAERNRERANFAVKKIVSDFMALVGNVIAMPSEKGVMADIKALVKEMDELMPDDDEEVDDEMSENKDSNAAQDLFMIWKDARTGEHRFLGVYSNKFRDDDATPEILADESHRRFIERVEKGELEYPVLYVWHIPTAIGKADLLAYDTAGFAIASGTIDEDFAIAIMKSETDWAMSHGMPARHIRRDQSDKSIITEYVSTEISVLPRWAAANKMTEFYVTKEERMAIIPERKRQQVADLLGEDLTAKLELGLSAKSEKAVADGIEFKEEATKEVALEQVEEEAVTAEAVAEVVEPEVEETAEEEATAEEGLGEEVEAKDEATEPAGASEAEVEADNAPEGVQNITKEELAEVLALVVDKLTERNVAFEKSLDELGSRLESIESSLHTMKSADEAKIAQLAASTPEASLTAMFTGRLGAQAQSVIGNPGAAVQKDSALAGKGPTETAPKGEEGDNQLFFKGW